MKAVLIFPLGIVFLQLSLGAENIKNFKAYDVTPKSKQIDALLAWRDEEGVDFWRSGAAGTTSRVMIPPKLQIVFEKFLQRNGIDYEIYMKDLGELEREFEAERVARLERKKIQPAVAPGMTPNFDVYWTNEEIQTYGQRLALTHPHLVRKEVIARTFEGRDVFALQISSGGFGRKPLIFIDGGMHAREWVSQASLMYFLNRLIEDPITSRELLEYVDWIIIPNLNPDGYNWAFTQNRLWRQNRHRINETCVGVDLNRNWRYTWREANANSCGNLIYPGESPMSEVEVAAMHNYMDQHRVNAKMYCTVHSFGDMFLYPWTYFESSGNISTWQYHHAVGDEYANAIRAATGKNIRVGNSIDILGYAYGVSDDHMAGEFDINSSFTLELTRGGITGFDFPEAQLGPLVRETFWGFRALGLHVARTY